MITAVDTNVLIDVLADNPKFVESSIAALRRCQQEGELVICEVVLAEIAQYFSSIDDLRKTISQLEISTEPLRDVVCHAAGYEAITGLAADYEW